MAQTAFLMPFCFLVLAHSRSKQSGPTISFDEEVRALKSGFQEVTPNEQLVDTLSWTTCRLIRWSFGIWIHWQIARELQQMNSELQTRINAMGELTQTVRPHSMLSYCLSVYRG